MHSHDGAAFGAQGRGTQIVADYSALARLAAELRGLAEALADAGASRPMTGLDDEIAAAVWSAERDWHAQRSRVTSYLRTTADGADAAAQAYRQSDLDIARASSAAGGGGGGRPSAH